jgi:hypothetical protein
MVAAAAELKAEAEAGGQGVVWTAAAAAAGG